MKTHARNLTIGAVLVPIALGISTAIANEAQTLLGLDLERAALALYILPFLAATAAAIAALIRLEAVKIGGELGQALGSLAGLFNAGPEPPGAASGPALERPPTPSAVIPGGTPPPPPPPPPAP